MYNITTTIEASDKNRNITAAINATHEHQRMKIALDTGTGSRVIHAAEADRLTTPRTIVLSGAVEGQGVFDGSGDIIILTTREDYSDYSKLTNKPTINGITLEGILNGYDIGLQDIFFDTTQNWNSQPGFVPGAGQIVIYADHGTTEDGSGNAINIPGIKIGDGNAYLIDLPFVGDDTALNILTELERHANDKSIHVTSEEKSFWNSKLNCEIVDEELIFNQL